MFVRQRTSQVLKSLKKHVRFVKPFPLPDRGKTLQTKEGFTSFKRLVRTCKELQGLVRRLQAFVKRVRAIQVFCLKASKDLNTSRYKLLKVFNNLSLC